MGTATLHFVSDQGEKCTLKLLRVLYVPGLSRRLFSVDSFTSTGNYSVLFQQHKAILRLSPKCSFTIAAPHVPDTSFIIKEQIQSEEVNNTDANGNNNVSNEHNTELTVADVQSQGGVDTATWKPTSELERKQTRNKKRMSVELGHSIFGHRSVLSLMNASHANVWDDVLLHFSGDTRLTYNIFYLL